MKNIVILIVSVAFLTACSTTPPLVVSYIPTKELMKPTQAPASPPAPPPEVVLDNPTDTSDEPTDSADATKLVDSNTQDMTLGPTHRTFDGGPVVYPYVDGRQYKIFASPTHQTNIVLQPGENIMGQPVTGDNSSFIMTNLLGKQGGQPVVNLFIIAKYPGRTTNVTILTDKRTYRLLLSSYVQTYMPVVRFTYETDALASFGGSPGSVDAQGKPTGGGSGDVYLFSRIDSLDFNYAIVPHTTTKPAWAPSMVFTDGTATYMQFASARGAAYAPIFIVLDDNNKPVIVNYRVKGIFYIIDRVIEHAQILLNKNDGNIIDIIRRH